MPAVPDLRLVVLAVVGGEERAALTAPVASARQVFRGGALRIGWVSDLKKSAI
jgi:hypothetical protein